MQEGISKWIHYARQTLFKCFITKQLRIKSVTVWLSDEDLLILITVITRGPIEIFTIMANCSLCPIENLF